MGAAALLGSQHFCPMQNPGPIPSPHLGGPIMGPATTKVLINNQPVALVGDLCQCSGPPAQIAMGSSSVFIEGKPVARVGDSTSHGGQILNGSLNVIIGG